MPNNYDPERIAQIKQVLSVMPSLDFLWFQEPEEDVELEEDDTLTHLSHFEPASGTDLLAWAAQELRAAGVFGEFLVHLDSYPATPWARVMLGDNLAWAGPLLSNSPSLSLSTPTGDLLVRLKLQVDEQTGLIQLKKSNTLASGLSQFFDNNHDDDDIDDDDIDDDDDSPS
jgi:hypothetical protein